MNGVLPAFQKVLSRLRRALTVATLTRPLSRDATAFQMGSNCRQCGHLLHHSSRPGCSPSGRLAAFKADNKDPPRCVYVDQPIARGCQLIEVMVGQSDDFPGAAGRPSCLPRRAAQDAKHPDKAPAVHAAAVKHVDRGPRSSSSVCVCRTRERGACDTGAH